MSCLNSQLRGVSVVEEAGGSRLAHLRPALNDVRLSQGRCHLTSKRHSPLRAITLKHSSHLVVLILLSHPQTYGSSLNVSDEILQPWQTSSPHQAHPRPKSQKAGKRCGTTNTKNGKPANPLLSHGRLPPPTPHLTSINRFYVNTYTKQSQWDKPTTAVYPPSSASPSAPSGPPPTYTGGNSSFPAEKSTNPYSSSGHAASTSSQDVDADARYAAKLQEEENARVRAAGGNNRDAQQDYVNTPMPQGYDQQLPPRPQQGGGGAKGFLSKLMGKSGHAPQQGGAYPGGGQPAYGYGQGGYGGGVGGYGGQPGYGGGYGGGYPPQHGGMGYGGYPQQGYGGGGMMQQPPRQSGGMGAMGGAALGAGAGLVGGMMIGEAMEDHDQNEYNQGYDQGQDSNGGGDDYGGGDDMGGGDF